VNFLSLIGGLLEIYSSENINGTGLGIAKNPIPAPDFYEFSSVNHSLMKILLKVVILRFE
jgi:hypothetical protein